MAEKKKNLVYAQIVRGVNKAKKVNFQLILSVEVAKGDKTLVLPFRTIYLSEFESIMIQDFVGTIEGKNFNNPNIIATIKRGLSAKGNWYYVFDVSLNVDNEIIPFKQALLQPFERISLIKRCGFDLTDIEKVELSDDFDNQEV